MHSSPIFFPGGVPTLGRELCYKESGRLTLGQPLFLSPGKHPRRPPWLPCVQTGKINDFTNLIIILHMPRGRGKKSNGAREP